MFDRLPYLGVWCATGRSATHRASPGRNAPYYRHATDCAMLWAIASTTRPVSSYRPSPGSWSSCERSARLRVSVTVSSLRPARGT